MIWDWIKTRRGLLSLRMNVIVQYLYSTKESTDSVHYYTYQLYNSIVIMVHSRAQGGSVTHRFRTECTVDKIKKIG